MRCPMCGHIESKVIDSRPSSDGSSIRRRRECLECQKRFTTYENIETLLYSRFVNKKIRLSGGRTKGPPKRTIENDEAFVKSLTKLLEEI